jgi:ParB/RepB/Spo0J family partition protein
MPSDQYVHVDVAKLAESKTNPRKLFGDLSEMASSIRAQGILQPLVARKVGGQLELVFGHRRLRAAKVAGLKEVPVIVREMSDVEVLEAQLTENLARADVHPLELAEGYRALMAVGKLTGDQVADRLGVSRSSVFTTLKLLDLVPEARKAFLAGRVASTAAAVAIARVRGERQQLAALAGVETEQKRAGGALPVRAVQRLVQSRFMGVRSKAEARRQAKASRPATSDAAYHARALELLLTRASEVVERKPALDDELVRLLLLALAQTEPATTDRLSAQGVRADRLATVRAPRLRALLVEAVLARWLPTEGAPKAVARVLGLSWAEVEKTARALLDAEEALRPPG